MIKFLFYKNQMILVKVFKLNEEQSFLIKKLIKIVKNWQKLQKILKKCEIFIYFLQNMPENLQLCCIIHGEKPATIPYCECGFNASQAHRE